jgi:sigma-B regulation protein RsbU (phosphoserine phosphatase)
MTQELSNPEASIESLTRNLLECYEELDLIYRVAARIMDSGDILSQLESILTEAATILEADSGWFLLLDRAANAAPAFGNLPAGRTAARLEREFIRPALHSGRSLMVGDLRSTLSPNDTDPGALTSFICTVLKTEQKVFGALCFGRNRVEAMFTAADFKLANTLATFASLALDHDAMYQEKLRQEQARFQMEEDLRLAARIQRDLLPSCAPEAEGYAIAGRSIPARLVGGDYFDFISLDDGRLAVCVADVTGKGLPAALLMTGVQATVRGQALLESPAAESIRQSNHLLYHTAAGMFVTLVFGILDPRRHTFCYSNAGHPPPLLVPATGKVRWLGVGGMILGFDETAGYEEECLYIRPGDILVVYSDGITEAENQLGEEFGSGRLSRLVQAAAGRPPEELINRILTAVERHSKPAPVQDDRTLLVIQRLE